MYKHGGVHEWDLTTAQVRNVSYWFYVARVNYGLTIMFTKLAILLLYRRVFLPQRWSTFDVITRLYLLIICLFYIASTAVKIWECTPRQRVWDKSQKGTCIDISRLLNASGLFNTISDVLILLVPVKSVWKLHMDRGRKVACVLLFTLSIFPILLTPSSAPVFSIIGFVVRVRISANPDISYTQPEILLWSAAEISTGIICICLPTLGALAQHRHHRPSSTILNGKFHSRSTRCSGPNPLTSSFNERDVFSNEYLELRENKPGRSDPTSKYAVFTAIRGGPSTPHSGMEEPRSSCECRGPEIYTTMLSDEEKCSEAAAAPDAGGIMKSYRIEQSYS
ncbi:hypothetical protein MMC07_007188 [Pseudocyphellaria aurata]|nr:hypothetical protein [Pseudocyphellaria aurata]